MIYTSLMRGRDSLYTPADYPTLKHFFNMLDAQKFVDVQGGVEWSCVVPGYAHNRMVYDAGLKAMQVVMSADTDASGVDTQQGLPTPLLSGSWTPMPSGAAMIQCVAGRIADLATCYDPEQEGWVTDMNMGPTLNKWPRFALGDSNGLTGLGRGAVGMSASGSFHIVIGEGGVGAVRKYTTQTLERDTLPEYSLVVETVPNGTDVLIYLLYQPGTLTYKAINIQTGAVIMEADTFNTSPNPPYSFGATAPAWTTAPCMRAAGAKWYGMAQFILPSGVLPADAEAGCLWMGNAWQRGWRAPYPGSVLW